MPSSGFSCASDGWLLSRAPTLGVSLSRKRWLEVCVLGTHLCCDCIRRDNEKHPRNTSQSELFKYFGMLSVLEVRSGATFAFLGWE